MAQALGRMIAHIHRRQRRRHPRISVHVWAGEWEWQV